MGIRRHIAHRHRLPIPRTCPRPDRFWSWRRRRRATARLGVSTGRRCCLIAGPARTSRRPSADASSARVGHGLVTSPPETRSQRGGRVAFRVGVRCSHYGLRSASEGPRMGLVEYAIEESEFHTFGLVSYSPNGADIRELHHDVSMRRAELLPYQLDRYCLTSRPPRDGRCRSNRSADGDAGLAVAAEVAQHRRGAPRAVAALTC
jgi:hypothetical protein